MVENDRKYDQINGVYRYGFNGKENDKAISEGAQDYGMRIYDERIVRFLSVDPITKKYPELTPYQFASNRPIDGIDRDGLEWNPADYIEKQVKGEIASTFQGAANWVDNFFSWGTKTKLETPIAPKKGGTEHALVVDQKTTMSTNLGDPMSYLIQNNTIKGYHGNVTKTQTTTDIKTESTTTVPTPAGTNASTVTSVDQQGHVEVSAKATVPIEGGAARLNVTVTKNTEGTASVGASVSTPSVNSTKGTAGATVTSDSKSTSVEVSVGVEVKQGDTKVSSSIFIQGTQKKP
jgi:RHS repeat-associated protein